MNPDDIDTGISSLVAGLVPEGIVRDAVAAQFQELQDEAVRIALEENAADLADRNTQIERLSGSLSTQAKKLALLHVAHNEKVELLHEVETKLAQLLRSRNPWLRAAAQRFRFVKGYETRRLDYTIAMDALAERDLQDAKWGAARHMPNGTGARKYILAEKEAQLATDTAFAKGDGTWLHILMEEVMEVAAETNPKHLKEELRQVIGVCIAWMIDLLTQKPSDKVRKTLKLRTFTSDEERARKALVKLGHPVDNRLPRE